MAFIGVALCADSKVSIDQMSNVKFLENYEIFALITDIAVAILVVTAGVLVVLQAKGYVNLGQLSGIGSIGTRGGLIMVGAGGALVGVDLLKLVIQQAVHISRLFKRVGEVEVELKNNPSSTTTSLSETELQSLQKESNRASKLDGEVETLMSRVKQLEEQNRLLQEGAESDPAPTSTGSSTPPTGTPKPVFDEPEERPVEGLLLTEVEVHPFTEKNKRLLNQTSEIMKMSYLPPSNSSVTKLISFKSLTNDLQENIHAVLQLEWSGETPELMSKTDVMEYLDKLKSEFVEKLDLLLERAAKEDLTRDIEELKDQYGHLNELLQTIVKEEVMTHDELFLKDE